MVVAQYTSIREVFLILADDISGRLIRKDVV